jgi:predicted ABC-type ATPase
MTASVAPRIVIFAGPNGAGKSTHADAILEAIEIRTFVNADYIARGLAGHHAETVAVAAGRIMLNRLKGLAAERQDFAFESTLSSRTFALFLKRLKADGYDVAIYYFSLANANLAIRRVKHRVALGGHDVPSGVVRRRFARSLHNFFNLYSPLANQWMVFDNSQVGLATPVASYSGDTLTIKEPKIWHKLQTHRTVP